MQEIPEQHRKTVAMLLCAFNDEDIDQYVHEIIRVLYEEMSDRSLAEVLALTTGFDYHFLYHEIYVCISATQYDIDRYNVVKERIEQCGLDKWRSLF